MNSKPVRQLQSKPINDLKQFKNKVPSVPIGPSAQTARNSYQREASKKQLTTISFESERDQKFMQNSYSTNNTMLANRSSSNKGRGGSQDEKKTKPSSYKQLLLKNTIASYSQQRE